MRTTAKSIAKKLGISTSAVSLALNGKAGVSEKTRELVLSEAIRMGYHTKSDAPSANKNIRYVIFLDETSAVRETSFYFIVLQGIEVIARKLGYNVLVSHFYAAQDWREQIAAITKDVSGLILLGTEIKDNYIYKAIENELGKVNLPLVLVDNATSIVDIDCVVADNLRGAYNAVSYLLQKGHKDVGYLRSPLRIDSFDERQAGYEKSRLEHGIPSDIAPPIIDVGISSEAAYYDLCRWLDSGNKPCSAYFADNDIIAASCARAFKQKGYRIPEDVAIIGFDDMPICTMIDPPLTTVKILKEQMGNVAMDILHQRIQDGSFNLSDKRIGVYRIVISTHLTERCSS